MPHEVMRRFEDIFQVRILEGYGLSEASPVVSFNQLQRPSKPGTVGLPIFGVTIACLDEQDQPVPTGERGEVVVRGPNVMKGYYNRPARPPKLSAAAGSTLATSAPSTTTATSRSSIAGTT